MSTFCDDVQRWPYLNSTRSRVTCLCGPAVLAVGVTSCVVFGVHLDRLYRLYLAMDVDMKRHDGVFMIATMYVYGDVMIRPPKVERQKSKRATKAASADMRKSAGLASELNRVREEQPKKKKDKDKDKDMYEHVGRMDVGAVYFDVAGDAAYVAGGGTEQEPRQASVGDDMR